MTTALSADQINDRSLMASMQYPPPRILSLLLLCLSSPRSRFVAPLANSVPSCVPELQVMIGGAMSSPFLTHSRLSSPASHTLAEGEGGERERAPQGLPIALFRT
jgi:hypothetical protein